MTDKTNRMPLDEIERLITDIARDPESGADRFRALKFAAAMQSSTAALPEPLDDNEVLDRLARLIRAAGPTAAQLAYRRAFPASKRPINHAAPQVRERDMPFIPKAELPGTLRALYKMFPEIKGPGCPKGFPMGKGLAVKKAWCQREAMKLLVDREQKRVDEIAIHAAPEEKPDHAPEQEQLPQA